MKLLVQVEVVGAEAAEAALGRRSQGRRGVRLAGERLRREEDALAPPAEQLTGDGLTIAVGLGGVEERPAVLERRVERAGNLVELDGAVTAPEGVEPEADTGEVVHGLILEFGS